MNFEEFKAKYQKAPVKEYPNRVFEAVPEPVVSVQISTYQHADFIRDCLDGVLMQKTDFPIEILIGEDASEDGTREICKEYADRHPDKIRLFLHRRENNIEVHGRPTPNFQWVYTHFKCRGKYVALCEGDDYWTDPLKLQKQVDFMESNSGCVMAYHPWVVKKKNNGSCTTESLLDDAKKKQQVKNIPQTMTLLFRNVLQRYPQEFLEVINGDMFLQALLRQEGEFVNVSSVKPGIYREHDGGIYSTLSQKAKALQSLHARVKILDAIDDETIRKEVESDAIQRFRWYLTSPAVGKDIPEHRKCLVGSLAGIFRHGLFLKSLLYVLKMQLGRLLKKYNLN